MKRGLDYSQTVATKLPVAVLNQATVLLGLDLPGPDQALGMRPMASNKHIKTRKGKVISGKGNQSSYVFQRY